MKKILLSIVIALSTSLVCSAQKSLILVGDGTMAPHSMATTEVYGWAEVMQQYFADSIQVINMAISGESTQTLINGRLEEILLKAQPNDYVLLQLGQNDLRDEIETMHSSTADMLKYLIAIVAKFHDKEIHVILSTPLAQPFYKAGQLKERMGSYPEAVRRAAQAKNVPLIDMEAITYEWLQSMDEEMAHIYYKNISPESTRKEYLLTKAGAEQISSFVVDQLRELNIEGLTEFIRPVY